MSADDAGSGSVGDPEDGAGAGGVGVAPRRSPRRKAGEVMGERFSVAVAPLVGYPAGMDDSVGKPVEVGALHAALARRCRPDSEAA